MHLSLIIGLALTMILSGCSTMPSAFQSLLGKLRPAASSLPAAGESTSGGVVSADTDQAISPGSYARPAIAVGPDGSLFVASEGAKMQSVHLFVRTAGSGSWSDTLLAHSERGGPCDASRVYVADIVVDADGWCWVSMRCGPKEWGKLHGPAIYVRAPSGSGSWRFLGLTTGAARLGLDPAFPGQAILLAKDGAWGAIDRHGNVTRTGNYPAGKTGEKFDLDIKGSTWATAHNGFSSESSAVSIGTASGGKRQTWAAHQSYPAQGNDLCYPSVCIVTGAVTRVYAQSVYDKQLRLQVFKNGRPVYPVDKLPSLGAAALEDRCPPRLIATSAGVVAVWVNAGSIYRVNVHRAIKGKAKAARIGAGSNPAVCIDGLGRIHLVYVHGGALRYRRLD